MKTSPAASRPLSFQDMARLVAERMGLIQPDLGLTITTPYVTLTDLLRMLRKHKIPHSYRSVRRWMSYPVNLLPSPFANLFAHDAPSCWFQKMQACRGGHRGLTYFIPLSYLSEFGHMMAEASGVARSFRDRLPQRHQFVLDALMRNHKVTHLEICRHLPPNMTLPRRSFFRIKHTLLQQEKTFRWKSLTSPSLPSS